MYTPKNTLTKTRDVLLGRMLGYDLTLKNVPEERAVHVERIARKEIEAMVKARHESIFGDVDKEIAIALHKPNLECIVCKGDASYTCNHTKQPKKC